MKKFLLCLAVTGIIGGTIGSSVAADSSDSEDFSAKSLSVDAQTLEEETVEPEAVPALGVAAVKGAKWVGGGAAAGAAAAAGADAYNSTLGTTFGGENVAAASEADLDFVFDN
ncbi:hypothetical protein B0H94_12011 [Salsuginibacillus halophilus]|uniref:Uncharacterized protein n=1 Tax=Salsuginibacillus halophilus TaxID=517424 RepID=A0A2P8H4W4_9BACI|nr:hypothetical protein [Salsuginibacillus halophilus]PSL41265.1 hypothetical protein B0H94_12011 [Salsuginibacillus halophilus]